MGQGLNKECAQHIDNRKSKDAFTSSGCKVGDVVPCQSTLSVWPLYSQVPSKHCWIFVVLSVPGAALIFKVTIH